VIYQAYLDITDKHEYQRRDRMFKRDEHARTAREFFNSKHYLHICDILNIDPNRILKKINEKES